MKRPVFHPMPGKIVVEAIEETDYQGLILPYDTKSRVLGRVIAVGGDEEDGDDYPVAVGDIVLFHQNSGVKVRIERTEVLFFRTAEILSTITWEEAADA